MQHLRSALAAFVQPQHVTISDRSREVGYEPGKTSGGEGNRFWWEAERQRDKAEADVQRYCQLSARLLRSASPTRTVA